MGDWCQVLIDVEASEREAPHRAERVRDLLVGRGVIAPAPSDDPLLSGGHEPGPRFATALADPLGEDGEDTVRSLRNDVVDIVVGRQVGYAGVETTQVLCPVCSHRYSDERWSDAVNAWALGDDEARATCGGCEVASPVQHIIFVPAWGFGHLTVTFWNWPRLHDAFVAELRTILGRFAVYQWWKM